jgi:hypothetical protein
MEDEIKYEWINLFIEDLLEIIKILKNYFENKWALTGSAAIFYLLYKNNLIEKYKIIPSDIDILISSNDLIYNDKIGEFKRVQSAPEKSVTYLRNNISKDHIINRLDISINQKIEYITIDGINIIKPEKILKIYESNLDIPDRDLIKDKYKIYILKELIERDQSYETKIINAKEESKKKLMEKIEINNNKELLDNISKKLLFN